MAVAQEAAPESVPADRRLCQLMRHMGRPTDASHDYDYTDWDAVDRLGLQIASTAGLPVSS